MSDELTADEAHELLVEAQLQAKLKADLHARAFDVLRTMLEFIDDGRLEYKSEGAFGGPVSNEIHRARAIIQEAVE